MPASTFHQIDVLHRNRAAIAVVDHENREPDRGFRRRDSEHQKSKNLADEVAEKGRKGDQIDVDREQDQLDRHQDDNDILPVEEDAENPEREQDRRDREVVTEPDGHDSPCPGLTLTISIAVALVRATWSAMFWRLTYGLWRSVKTIAPIMATSSTTPAA